MRILLTGATGYIGSGVLDALARAGHEVTALVRTQAAAERFAARELRCVVADLGEDLASASALRGFDAYVHTAFEASARGAEIDRQAVAALGAAARDSGAQAFVYTSGIWVLGPTSGADEHAPVNPTPLVAFRPAHEQAALAFDTPTLRALVVRPGVVYGGGRGIVGDMLRDAENGIMRVIGTGENHWPLVYDRDLADLYVRLVSNAEARGIYHATMVSTVSPTYAREAMTPEGGHGLDGLLRHRSFDLHGVLNGLDHDTWNPAADPHLAQRFDARTLDERIGNKRALQQRMGLPQRWWGWCRASTGRRASTCSATSCTCS